MGTSGKQSGQLVATAMLAIIAAAHAAPATALNVGVTTGQAALTIENYPLPPTWRPHGYGVELLCGPEAISGRATIGGSASYIVQYQTFAPVGSALRFVNYTTHPSVTPGLENYTCVEYALRSYATNVEGPASFFTADSLFVAQSQVQRGYAQLGFQLRSFLLWSKRVRFGNSTLPANATTADTTDFYSRIQVSGPGLLPFTFDKQALLLDAVMTSSRVANVPIALANVTDWRAAAAARNGSRRLLQTSVDKFSLTVWTELIPNRNLTAMQMWPMIAPGIRAFTKAAGFPMAIALRNATVYTRLKGQPMAIISTEPATAPGSITIRGQDAAGSNGSGRISSGAIAGIVAGFGAAVALLAALAGFAFLRKRRQREAADRKLAGVTSQAVHWYKPDGRSGSTSSTSDMSSSAGSIAISPEDVEICLHPDGRIWLLGAGNFGKVYRGLWRGHHDVAVKQLTCLSDDMLLSALHKEINILKHVSFNRNVVQFYGFCVEVSAPMLVMELMEGGDLRKALWQNQEEYAWDKRGAQVALDIARGLHFLHSSGVIHRDIKTSNVLLTREGVAKIADVGLAITADYFSAGSATGTFSYAAPELLMGGKCSPKVDSYSFGVVLWEIITKQPPVRGHLREVRDDEAPPEIHQLLEDCINVDVAQRPDAAEIVARLQAATPGLAAASSRSLGSVTSASLAAGAMQFTPLLQPLNAGDSIGEAGSSELHQPAISAVQNFFAAQEDLQRQDQSLPPAAEDAVGLADQ